MSGKSRWGLGGIVPVYGVRMPPADQPTVLFGNVRIVSTQDEASGGSSTLPVKRVQTDVEIVDEVCRRLLEGSVSPGLVQLLRLALDRCEEK